MEQKIKLIDGIFLVREIEPTTTITKEKMQYSLQGHYGRTVTALIIDGWLDRHGNILKELV